MQLFYRFRCPKTVKLQNPRRFFSKMENRKIFTDFLAKKHQNANGLTYGIVKSYNCAALQDVPMSDEHLQIAMESISNGDPICTFLRLENSEVVKSEGEGCLYSAGKIMHVGLSKIVDNNDKIPKEPSNPSNPE